MLDIVTLLCKNIPPTFKSGCFSLRTLSNMDVRIDLTATHGEAVAAMISVFVGWVCLHFSLGLLRVLAKCADGANQLYGKWACTFYFSDDTL